MKRHRTKPPPIAVPRLDSLLYRLQNAPAPDGESYLDQLMIFLEDPPPGVRDRWKQGAKMCAAGPNESEARNPVSPIAQQRRMFLYLGKRRRQNV